MHLQEDPREIDLPFRFDAQGRVAFTQSRARQVANRLLSLIGTIPSERVMRGRYGTNASQSLFENSFNLAGNIAASIKGAIARYEPEVTIRDISTNESHISQGAVDITILYTIREQGLEKTYQATISTGGEVREVVEIG